MTYKLITVNSKVKVISTVRDSIALVCKFCGTWHRKDILCIKANEGSSAVMSVVNLVNLMLSLSYLGQYTV